MSGKVPAVILGAGINGLGVARSLARARVPVWLLDADPHRAELRTRAARPLRIASLHGEALVDELLRIAGERFAGVQPVLLLTQEASVKWVSRHRDRLAPHFRFSLPPAAVVEALLHKQGFQRIAEQLGSPIPPLVHVRAPADIAAVAALRFPVAIKPGERHAEYGRQFKKAYRVDSVSEAAALLQRILAVMPDVVVQEWIEGPDANIYFCLQHLDRGGRVSASFTGRKIRSWPPQVGGTASCTAAPEVHAELSDLTARFLRDAGVVGMASMEYKRDARDGVFRMVEPTVGRTDYQEEVATLHGVNLPYAAYCSELGMPSPGVTAVRRPVVWRVRSEDLQSAAAQAQQPGDGMPNGARRVDALFRWGDPLPALAQLWRRAGHACARRAAKVMPRTRAAGSNP